MYAFEYLRPASLQEAVASLRADPEAKVLAGGQSLIASMKLRLSAPTRLIDLSGVSGLAGVSRDVDCGMLTIGAMTRHADVAASGLVRLHLPVLSELAGMIGDRMVRQMGTIGGSIANNDPAADYPAAALGLGADIVTSERIVPAAEFFVGMFETLLRPGEIITSIRLPAPDLAAYVKLKNPASRFATVGVFVSRTAGKVRVAITGAGAVVFRMRDMEQALTERFTPDALRGIPIEADELNGDLHASAAYRAQLIGVATRRAVVAALARQGERSSNTSATDQSTL